MSFYDHLVSALQKVAGGDANIQAEVDAIKAEQANFESTVNAQVAAAVNAAVASLGVSPAQIAGLVSDVEALKAGQAAEASAETAADAELNPPAPEPAPAPPPAPEPAPAPAEPPPAPAA